MRQPSSRRYATGHDPATARSLLERLTDVEAFEHFLQRVFPGKTRFSIEGVDMLVPMLDQVIGLAAEASICAIFIGMAHRGRLNVLAHVLNKPYAQLLAEFRDPVGGHNFAIRDDLGWTGDVKYHKGAQRAVGAEGRGHGRAAGVHAAEPQPPGARRPGGRRHGTRGRQRDGRAGARRSCTIAQPCRS